MHIVFDVIAFCAHVHINSTFLAFVSVIAKFKNEITKMEKWLKGYTPSASKKRKTSEERAKIATEYESERWQRLFQFRDGDFSE